MIFGIIPINICKSNEYKFKNIFKIQRLVNRVKLPLQSVWKRWSKDNLGYLCPIKVANLKTKRK
jgi:hypothetical protein